MLPIFAAVRQRTLVQRGRQFSARPRVTAAAAPWPRSRGALPPEYRVMALHAAMFCRIRNWTKWNPMAMGPTGPVRPNRRLCSDNPGAAGRTGTGGLY
jgi:hypothetical protein